MEETAAQLNLPLTGLVPNCKGWNEQLPGMWSARKACREQNAQTNGTAVVFGKRVHKPGFLFCRSADCDVVYFHPDGDSLRKPDVRVRVGLKETEDPVSICYCFGFTEAMAVEEIRATGKCTNSQRITAEVKAGNCACEIRNPQGSCCLGNVNAAVKRAAKVVSAEKSRSLA